MFKTVEEKHAAAAAKAKADPRAKDEKALIFEIAQLEKSCAAVDAEMLPLTRAMSEATMRTAAFRDKNPDTSKANGSDYLAAFRTVIESTQPIAEMGDMIDLKRATAFLLAERLVERRKSYISDQMAKLREKKSPFAVELKKTKETLEDLQRAMRGLPPKSGFVPKIRDPMDAD